LLDQFSSALYSLQNNHNGCDGRKEKNMENANELGSVEADLKRAEADLANARAAEQKAEQEIDQARKELRQIVTIIVNGTPYGWPKDDDITYAQVVTLDVPDYPQHPDVTYSVKYKNGPHSKPEGTLSPGGSVKVKQGMVFSVSSTGQS
jgi:Multiubiquitin